MEHRLKAKMIRKLDSMLNTLSNRAVFLFGHANATLDMADYLLQACVTPSGILDNNASKQGGSYQTIPILPPEFMLSYTSANSIVLIASRFYPEMAKQLRSLRYDGDIIQVV